MHRQIARAGRPRTRHLTRFGPVLWCPRHFNENHGDFFSGRESAGGGPGRPGQDRDPRISHAGCPGRRSPDEDGSRRHLRHRRASLPGAAEQQAHHHGAREHRLHRQGRPRVHPAQGLQGRRPRLRRALCQLRQVRVVPPRPVSPLREHQLAHQPGRDPLRLHLGREAAASVGRVRAIRLPALEFGRSITCPRASRPSSPGW